jgi:Cd(II)/Pb(II)-responsive transcriptional regulator
MKIGELAKQVNCSVETIRYYEKAGLIPAGNRDPNNNYRRYSQAHLTQLTFVRHCRALAMSHEEILELIKARQQANQNCGSIDQLIEDHLEHVSSKIRELQILEQQLIALRQQCQQSGSNDECGIIKDLDSPLDNTELLELDQSHIKGSH